jgi:hypothetical protein
MAPDCYALIADIRGHSSLCVVECGGIQVQSGDMILARAPFAGALHVQYKPHLSEPKAVTLCGSKSLRHGHYELRKHKQVVQGQKRVDYVDIKEKHVEKIEEPRHEEPKPNVEEVKAFFEKKEPESIEVSEHKSIEDIADNRSMENPKAKKKARRKRQPAKAKRKETLDDA